MNEPTRIMTARFALLASALLLGSLGAAQAQDLPKATLVLNWFPEPEAGGFYAAVADGLYKAKGLDLTILPGGPSVNGTSLMAAGRVQFAELDAAAVLFARDQGIPALGVFATFQTFPQGLMYHSEKPLKSFADLAGRQVAVSPGAQYWEYIVSKYKLDGKVQVVNYNGQLADWLRDKNRVTQNYVTSEPFFARKSGAAPRSLLIADSGYNPYGNLVSTTESYLKDNPKLVKAFVEATQEGWKRYLATPAKYDAVMIAANKDLTPDYLAFSAKAQKPLIATGDALKYGLGYMSADRWNTLLGQMTDLKLFKTKLEASAAFDMSQFPKK